VPALPSCLIEPIWEQFTALLPARLDRHPLGCHRPRISDRMVFELLINVLVFGSGYRRHGDRRCSATTLRRRRDEWIKAGVMGRLEAAAREGYDRLIGLELSDVAVDGCLTKAPCGGEVSGPNPTDRGKLGIKRSTLVDAGGLPLVWSAPQRTGTTPRCWHQYWTYSRTWAQCLKPLSSTSTPATTPASLVRCWPSVDCRARSRTKGCPHQSKPPDVG